MTDQDHADAVWAACLALNDVVENAEMAGLRVDVVLVGNILYGERRKGHGPSTKVRAHFARPVFVSDGSVR